jgi:LysR family transcriptional regulator, glycine cleavage system transcriptional activator
MGFRLPPLNALRLFEAAGRHLSFKLAAKELDITPSAVSHGVQGLEDWLGTQLFARSARGLSLTEAGATYLPAVRDSLALLASASERIPGRRSAEHIRISVSPTFGARVLLPKLGHFRDRHPGTAAYIDTTHHQVAFPQDGADLAIRMGTGEWAGLEAECLLYEDLVPVCASAMREQFQSAASITELPLVHVTTVTHDWNSWLEFAGQDPPDENRGLRVDTLQMAFDAALRGMGVVLGRRPLVDPELEAGTLVTLVDQTLRSPTAYWLVGLPETMTRPDIQAFRAWLIEELSVYSVHAAAKPKAFALADNRGERAASPTRVRQRGGGR